MISIRSFFACALIACVVITCASALSAQEKQEGRLLLFPDIYKDKVAFVYGGDLWLVASTGGTARRITSSPGREQFPKFSPDGKWLAFTGQYDGNFNVYVMPSEGGQPKQLTFYQGQAQPLSDRMGVLNEVVGWTPDSKNVIFLSRRDASNGWAKRPSMVAVSGGLPQPFAMDEGGLLSYSPDGGKIAYNRIFRNFRQWKRYTGGMAQDITIYDLKNNTIEGVVPHTEYTDTFPMWHGNTIFFSSDRGADHRLNLYSFDTGSKQIQQLTNFDQFDVMWPSLGPDAIVFENGGYLYTFDLESHQAKKLTVYLDTDRDQAMKHWVDASRHITDFDIAPDGKRAVFGARGEVFTVPAKEGSVRNLTNSPGAREQKVAWSPDGKWIAYVSDRTGEDEIYISPQDGLGPEEAVTSGHKGFMYQPVWSPDSTKIAWSDQEVRLWYVDIKAKKPVQVDRGKFAEILNYNWSPDSQWLAYDKAEESGFAVVYLYSLANSKITPVTSALENSYAAVFDPDKRYLYFLSDRDFNEVIGNIDFEFANPKTTRVYVITLTADEPSPFPALSDEVKVKAPEPAVTTPVPEQKPETKKNKQPPANPPSEKEQASGEKTVETEAKQPPRVFKIDLDGIENRVVALAVPPAVIVRLDASKDAVYYGTTPIQGLSGPLPGEEPAIHAYDLKDRKDKVLIEGGDRFALSADGSKLLYRTAGEGPAKYGIIDAKPTDSPHKAGDGVLNTSAMRAEVDPPLEWKEIYNEVYRQERDFFFEASMNGNDWAKIRDQYAQLLPYVADRYSLTYIMAQLIAELSNSHTYVGGGEFPELHPVNVGLLGADYELDAASGMYRFKKIYAGENWDAQVRSPLTEPGVNVKEGDYLVAINGHTLHAPQTPDELLVNTANQVVTLTVNSKGSADGAHKLVVKPIADEFRLRELNMIESNRNKVDAASGGKIGYVYLPDMGDAGLNEFVRQYFPQIRKQGIIIDVRYNGGGFVDQLIFARLRRILAAMDNARNFEPSTVPQNVFHGYMACITNHMAASDGDLFSYFFKVYKLGPLIGERTWGGVRGIRGMMPLMDGGYITRPEFALYGLDSKWLIENKGVEPDVVVDNRPDLVVKGQDPQLEKAIDLVMQQIKANPKKLPSTPPDLPAYPEGPGL
ncbi:MAG TPA: PDZ domain-containing protein [Terriglobales bacterium]|nr:PDZ domain-containing protein [Terriglobales bacterium]